MWTRLFALLLACAALPAAARTMVANVNGYTLDARGAVVRFAGLLIGTDGKIERVLTRGEAEPLLLPGDYRFDAKGRTLLPGLIDAHGHVMDLGREALTVDLTGTKSLDEALDRVRAWATANPQAKWIVGDGWNQVLWARGFPTAAELDRAVADRPAFIQRIDGHAGWANSAALKLARVSAATPDPAGGRIERGPGRAPSGVFVDGAKVLIERHIPASTPLEQEAALTKAFEIMASVGLTGVHDAGITPAQWNLYRRFGDEGRLTARITAMAGGMDALDAIAPLHPTPWLYEDRLRLGTVKLLADGALGSRGAWLKQPYSDDPGNRGLQFHPDTVLKNWVSRANYLGFQVAVHAIGDAANAQVLDAYADNRATYGDTRRNRIEHAQIVDPVDLPRFAQLHVIASMQPTHATSDKAMAADRLGEARLKGAYAWRTIIDSGARFAFGSDFPVEPPNAFFGLHAAVTRQDRSGEPPGGWRPQEAVSLKEAFAGFTTGAAYAGFAEDRVGRLAPGYWADFVIVDRDPFEISPSDLWRVGVEETWLAGRRVFSKDAKKG
jgi:predicted amidohydrolase YtcJ